MKFCGFQAAASGNVANEGALGKKMSKSLFDKVLLLVLSVFLLAGRGYAFDPGPVDTARIEEVMRAAQSCYHYAAVAHNQPVKYLQFPSRSNYDYPDSRILNAGFEAAPAWPMNYYGGLRQEDAEVLVSKFTDSFYSNWMSSRFLYELPTDQAEPNYISTLIEPAEDLGWKKKLSYIENDLMKLGYIAAYGANAVDPVVKCGYGSDGPDWDPNAPECEPDYYRNGSFGDAKAALLANYAVPTNYYWPVGAMVSTSDLRNYITGGEGCNNDYKKYFNSYGVSYSMKTCRLTADLRKYSGVGHCFLKLWTQGSEDKNDGTYFDGIDGPAAYAPVAVGQTAAIYKEWSKKPACSSIWTSDYLFDPNVAPEMPEPTRSCDDSDSDPNTYTKQCLKSWFLSAGGGVFLVVEPNYVQLSDEIIALDEPVVKMFKDRDSDIVYSGSTDSKRGECIWGRIVVPDYKPGMKVEFLNKAVFDSKIAGVEIFDRSLGEHGNFVGIDGSKVNSRICVTPYLDDTDPNNPVYFVRFYIEAFEGECDINVDVSTLYSEYVDTDSNSDDYRHIKAWRGDCDGIKLKVCMNGYECYGRKSTVDIGLQPLITQHENGSIEVFDRDIQEAYILKPAFYDMDISEIDGSYLKGVTATGPYLLLRGAGGGIVYQRPVGWGVKGVKIPEIESEYLVDEAGNVVKEVSNSSGRQTQLETIGIFAGSTAAISSGFQFVSYTASMGGVRREYHYLGESKWPFEFVDYAGSLSRLYTVVYDGNGYIAGVVDADGNAGDSGCLSCGGGSGGTFTYYDTNHNIDSIKDSSGNTLYHFGYDSRGRQRDKWLGAGTDSPIERVEYYTTAADNFRDYMRDRGITDWAEIKDIYEYSNSSDYAFRRELLDGQGGMIAELRFGSRNISAGILDSDPNSLGDGVYVTKYDREYLNGELRSVSAYSPEYMRGNIRSYHKEILQTSSNLTGQSLLVRTLTPGTEAITVLSQTTGQRISWGDDSGQFFDLPQSSSDYFGLVNNQSVIYDYDIDNDNDIDINDGGLLDKVYYLSVTQADGKTTQLVIDYDYLPGGRIHTESNGITVTTHIYDGYGYESGIQISNATTGSVLYTTRSRNNGFGEKIWEIDRSGVARGFQRDDYGRLLSEFVFADPNDPNNIFDGHEVVADLYHDFAVVSQSKTVYDSLGRVYQVWMAVDPAGIFIFDEPESWRIVEYGYDAYGRKEYQLEKVSVDGTITTTVPETWFVYDNSNNSYMTIYPDGHWVKSIYDGRGLVKETVTGNGWEDSPTEYYTTGTDYNADGKPLREYAGDKVVRSYQYDTDGLVLREFTGNFDAAGTDYTEYVRDDAGNVQEAWVVDGASGLPVMRKAVKYNALGQVYESRVLDSIGENDTLDQIVVTSFDKLGRVVETVQKSVESLALYDGVGNLMYEDGDRISQQWYNAAGELEYSVKFDYAFVAGHALPFANAGKMLEYLLTTENTESTEGKICVEKYTYSGGLLYQSFVFAGIENNEIVWQLQAENDYDNAGRLIAVTDVADNVTTLDYNSLGQTTETVLWQGRPVLRFDEYYEGDPFVPYPVRQSFNIYDYAGRLLETAQIADFGESVTPAVKTVVDIDILKDKAIFYYYDPYGRQNEKTWYYTDNSDKFGVEKTEFDNLGRVKQITTYAAEYARWIGGSIFATEMIPLDGMEYFYEDGTGRKYKETHHLLNTQAENGDKDINAWYEYYDDGRLFTVANDNGIVQTMSYGPLGVKQVITPELTTQYRYDQFGQLWQKADDPAGLNRVTEYWYDRFGQQTDIISGTERTHYDYNHLGEVTKITYPANKNKSIEYKYDSKGSVVRRKVMQNGDTQVTQYGRNDKGLINFKQYTGEANWQEPNSLLPFDEYCYNAAGAREIVACIDNDSDFELSIYSYNGLGNMLYSTESSGLYAGSVSYEYNQMGLVTSMTYPNEDIVTIQRDAIGRILSIAYNDKEIISYGWLGNSVVYKNMPTEGIEYSAIIDSIGRMDYEVYTQGNTVLREVDYDYNHASKRIEGRNGIEYDYDTLNKLTAEDQLSYISDKLGNPSNAPDDGLAYLADEEDRIEQVKSGNNIIADYSYSRLGKRMKKTVNDLNTFFVYDFAGNIVSEYQSTGTNTPVWAKNYVYGATGEAVYMNMPRTASMDESLANLYLFADAWLCEPNCTTAQLTWDSNADYQVDMLDLAAFHAYMDLAYARSGRMLLADSRNSVIGKIDFDGDLTSIDYSAWGTPTVSAGSSLEGLAILWNGYYRDTETGNYYLRNRYYSPVERKFLTDDPHGVNPDGNWNNSFGPEWQYADGTGLGVFVGHNPINYQDSLGLQSEIAGSAAFGDPFDGIGVIPSVSLVYAGYYGWTYAKAPVERLKESTTFLYADSLSRWRNGIKGLAETVKLDEEEFYKWGKRAIEKVNGVRHCGARVANTAYIHVGSIDSIAFGWHYSESNRHFVSRSKELKSLYQLKGYYTVLKRKVDSTAIVSTDLADSNIIAWAIVAHGLDKVGTPQLYPSITGPLYDAGDANNVLHHHLAQVFLYVCEAAKINEGPLKTQGINWKSLISKYGTVHMTEEAFYMSTTDLYELPSFKRDN